MTAVSVHAVCVVAACTGSGFASLVYEVPWTRRLTLALAR